jgi:hypothetical protein
MATISHDLRLGLPAIGGGSGQGPCYNAVISKAFDVAAWKLRRVLMRGVSKSRKRPQAALTPAGTSPTSQRPGCRLIVRIEVQTTLCASLVTEIDANDHSARLS